MSGYSTAIRCTWNSLICKELSRFSYPFIHNKFFTDAWEQRRLGDGAKNIGDGIHGTPKYNDSSDIAFINGNNLINGNICITEQTKFVNDSERTVHDKNLNRNMILLSINGTIGNIAWYNGEKIMLGKSVAYKQNKRCGLDI